MDFPTEDLKHLIQDLLKGEWDIWHMLGHILAIVRWVIAQQGGLITGAEAVKPDTEAIRKAIAEALEA